MTISEQGNKLYCICARFYIVGELRVRGGWLQGYSLGKPVKYVLTKVFCSPWVGKSVVTVAVV